MQTQAPRRTDKGGSTVFGTKLDKKKHGSEERDDRRRTEKTVRHILFRHEQDNTVYPHLKKDGYGARNNAGGIEGEERQKMEE